MGRKVADDRTLRRTGVRTKIPCNRCRKPFRSIDPKRNRRCIQCERVVSQFNLGKAILEPVVICFER